MTEIHVDHYSKVPSPKTIKVLLWGDGTGQVCVFHTSKDKVRTIAYTPATICHDKVLKLAKKLTKKFSEEDNIKCVKN